jgi:hypothetical protein
MVEAGRGMGMTELQLLRRVELPMALPVIIAGVRIAAVQVVATATLAAVPLWLGVSLRIGKHRALVAAALQIAVLSLPLVFLRAGDTWALVTWIAVRGSSFASILFSRLDGRRRDRRGYVASGEQRSGLYFAVWTVTSSPSPSVSCSRRPFPQRSATTLGRDRDARRPGAADSRLRRRAGAADGREALFAMRLSSHENDTQRCVRACRARR